MRSANLSSKLMRCESRVRTTEEREEPFVVGDESISELLLLDVGSLELIAELLHKPVALFQFLRSSERRRGEAETFFKMSTSRCFSPTRVESLRTKF
jgi:hypothetical protein